MNPQVSIVPSMMGGEVLMQMSFLRAYIYIYIAWERTKIKTSRYIIGGALSNELVIGLLKR